MNSVLVVAGEASGDTLGASIIEAFPEKNKIEFWGFGGPRMEKAGVRILHYVDELATIGFWEAAVQYRKLKRYAHELADLCEKKGVKHAVLIDYPGFNLYLAALLKERGIKNYLVVSPQIWAWHYSRIEKIKKNIETVLCLYRFETSIFDKEGVSSHFIGHPLVEKIKESKSKLKTKSEKIKKRFKGRTIIALLPGSRISEVNRHIPFLLDCALGFRRVHTTAEFFIPTPTKKIHDLVKSYNLPEYVHLFEEESHLVLQTAEAAIACSGTVTLECSLFDLPFLLIYKTSFLTYHIAKRLISGDFIGLVNIISEKEVTKEFIQQDMKVKPVLKELDRILHDKAYRKNMLRELAFVNKNVISPNPAKKAAGILTKLMK